MLEHFFYCPYCGAEVSILLDSSESTQSYIEDCEVCCNPIEVDFAVVQGDLIQFEAVSIEQ